MHAYIVIITMALAPSFFLLLTCTLQPPLSANLIPPNILEQVHVWCNCSYLHLATMHPKLLMLTLVVSLTPGSLIALLLLFFSGAVCANAPARKNISVSWICSGAVGTNTPARKMPTCLIASVCFISQSNLQYSHNVSCCCCWTRNVLSLPWLLYHVPGSPRRMWTTVLHATLCIAMGI